MLWKKYTPDEQDSSRQAAVITLNVENYLDEKGNPLPFLHIGGGTAKIAPIRDSVNYRRWWEKAISDLREKPANIYANEYGEALEVNILQTNPEGTVINLQDEAVMILPLSRKAETEQRFASSQSELLKKVFWFNDDKFRSIDEVIGWLVTTPEGRKLHQGLRKGEGHEDSESPRPRNEKLIQVLSKVENQVGIYGENGIIDLSLEGTDKEFRAQIEGTYGLHDRIEHEDNLLLLLDGVRQTQPHGGYDVLDHTHNLLQVLETDQLTFICSSPGINKSTAELVRSAGLLHDIGKAVDAIGDEHPDWGAEITEKFLRKTGLYSEKEIELVGLLVGNHELISGVVLGRKGEHELKSVLEKAEKYGLSQDELMQMIIALNKVDVISIPAFGQRGWDGIETEMKEVLDST